MNITQIKQVFENLALKPSDGCALRDGPVLLSLSIPEDGQSDGWISFIKYFYPN